MENKKYWIWLSRISTLDLKTKKLLLEKYETPDKIYNLTQNELSKIFELTEKQVQEILEENYRKNLEKYIEYMKENQIDVITIQDLEYPTKLLQIYDSPIVLYVKGNKEILNDKAVSIVGCRLATPYGKNIAEKLSYDLSMHNINIISGLAKGIDTSAHLGNLRKVAQEKEIIDKTKGKTIAVIGNGLDNVYPYENKELVNKIIESGGAIISEYIIGTKPEKMNFPARNRIISGLAEGIVVVEAKEKSGSLITVDLGIEQGKEIFAVPGEITNKNSQGTNELIKQGAIIVTNVDDIIQNLQ